MIGNRLKELRKKQRITLEKMSEMTGFSVSYIQRLESGERNLAVKHLDKFAPALGVTQREILPDNDHLDSALVLDNGDEHLPSEGVAAAMDPPDPAKTIRIKGYVGAGSEAHFYKLADESFEAVEPPAGASDQTIAVQIKGKSWGPRMDGWLVFYDDVRSPITEDMYNQPCVVGLADDRILLKTIKRERDGSFTLQSNSDEPDMRNAEIEWAAKVIGMRPR